MTWIDKYILCIITLRPKRPRVKKELPPFWYFLNLQKNENIDYLYVIKFLFDRRLHSWTVQTPDKYEAHWKYLTYTFPKSKFLVREKLTNGALVTPNLGSTSWWLFWFFSYSSVRVCIALRFWGRWRLGCSKWSVGTWYHSEKYIP